MVGALRLAPSAQIAGHVPRLGPFLQLHGAMKCCHLLLAVLATACAGSHTPIDDTGATGDAAADDRVDGGLVVTSDSGPDGAGDGGSEAGIDGGSDAAIDAGIDADRVGLVQCGTAECLAPAQACRATCRSGGMAAPVCIDTPEGWETGVCPSGGDDFPIVVARCDGPEDCGAEACLVLFGSVGNYPRCGCDDGPDGGCVQPSSVALCHDVSDCPSRATACETNVDLLQGFYRTCVE